MDGAPHAAPRQHNRIAIPPRQGTVRFIVVISTPPCGLCVGAAGTRNSRAAGPASFETTRVCVGDLSPCSGLPILWFGSPRSFSYPVVVHRFLRIGSLPGELTLL